MSFDGDCGGNFFLDQLDLMVVRDFLLDHLMDVILMALFH